jgi:hypothetical protein
LRGGSAPRIHRLHRYKILGVREVLISVTQLCTVQVDLKELPPRAFQVQAGQNGKYYQGMYQLGLVFGPELVFKFMFNGQVYGTAMARYF